VSTRSRLFFPLTLSLPRSRLLFPARAFSSPLTFPLPCSRPSFLLSWNFIGAARIPTTDSGNLNIHELVEGE
jgi:hypothetical protein